MHASEAASSKSNTNQKQIRAAMAPALLDEYSSQELLQAHLQLWHHALGYFKSLALAIAMDLRVADAIRRLGGAATLPEIRAETGIDPCRLDDLRRLMRVLTVTGVFGAESRDEAAGGGKEDDDEEEQVYRLTAASRLLLRGSPHSLSSQLMLLPCRESTVGRGMHAWFRLPRGEQERRPGLSPFALMYGGQSPWERADRDAAAFPLDDAMASDTAFLVPIVLAERGDALFRGLTSLVDVAGGLGGASATIAAAFPGLKCTVLDLPQVVAKAPSGTSVHYVAGDMFQSIPPANAVFLKWILHDWGDDDCVKILKNCKQAIPPRDQGGKVIIIDMVVGSEPSDTKQVETQVLYDFFMMSINGVERNEKEWKKIFVEAGFEHYKITPVLGVRSIIELFP